MKIDFQNTLEFAKLLDGKDRLRKYRDQFILPFHNGTSAIYFLGNSLGLQPRKTAGHIEAVLKEWGENGVEGFFRGNNPWLKYHEQLVQPLSEIVGALPDEIVVMNQLTVNLHLMLVSFYRPQGRRKKILCEAKAFPSDQYMLETHLKQRGLDPNEIIIEVRPRAGEVVISEDDITNAIKENAQDLALVFWGGVNYYTGQAFDMERITREAQNAGAKAGFDLAHAAGNIPLLLHEWNVDFACWCSYKYLNSGPGAIAGAFVHQRYHHDKTIERFAGWWGYKKDTRFLMLPGFEPTPNAEGWQLSTPAIILYAAHKAALEIFSQAGMHNIFEKGRLLNHYLVFLINQINNASGSNFINILTPEKKGSQLSLQVNNSKMVFDVLTEKGVFADWREPDVIRVAPAALYNTFEEVYKFAEILEQAVKN